MNGEIIAEYIYINEVRILFLKTFFKGSRTEGFESNESIDVSVNKIVNVRMYV